MPRSRIKTQVCFNDNCDDKNCKPVNNIIKQEIIEN